MKMSGSRLAREIRKKSAFACPEQELCLNLVRTAERLMGQFNALFRAHGLSNATYNVLRILRGEGGEGLPCLEIRRRLVTPLADITRLVDGLLRAGLVARRRSSGDRRVVFVQITPKGLDLLARLDGPVLELHRRQFQHLSVAQIKQLNALVDMARSAEAD